MIGPKEKNIRGDKRTDGRLLEWGDLDLEKLPKYISYKSALLQEKSTLRFIILLLLLMSGVILINSRLEITTLQGLLRKKEFILAPGVVDFVTASPENVSDSYISDAVTDFLSDLGNINKDNIDEQYARLKRFMGRKLNVKFELDTSEWVEQVKEDGLSQILTIKSKKIISDKNGFYKIIAKARADFYVASGYFGYEDQVYEMVLKLIPPKNMRRWSLQIVSLRWQKEENFNKRKKMKKGNL